MIFFFEKSLCVLRSHRLPSAKLFMADIYYARHDATYSHLCSILQCMEAKPPEFLSSPTVHLQGVGLPGELTSQSSDAIARDTTL